MQPLRGGQPADIDRRYWRARLRASAPGDATFVSPGDKYGLRPHLHSIAITATHGSTWYLREVLTADSPQSSCHLLGAS